MKAQIISIVIILLIAIIFSTLGLFIHKEENKVKSYFKWPKIKK
jgi:hypothetical protein